MVVAPPLRKIASDRLDVSRYRDALGRLERTEADIPAMLGRLEDLRKRPDDGAFLAPSSPALMTALMQDKAQALLLSTDAVLHSSRTLPVVDQQGFDRVGVELSLAASALGLSRLLHAVATSKPDIIVDEMIVQVPESGPEPDGGDVQPKFEVELKLSSYAKPKANVTGP